ncbi:hypothetical protein M3J09_007786 [Ascochyta lentis]
MHPMKLKSRSSGDQHRSTSAVVIPRLSLRSTDPLFQALESCFASPAAEFTVRTAKATHTGIMICTFVGVVLDSHAVLQIASAKQAIEFWR